jgi:hypothetical protein
MKTIHSFEIIEASNCSAFPTSIYPESKITIHSEATLEDMLYAFERFLQSAGYVLPKDSVLDFVEL